MYRLPQGVQLLSPQIDPSVCWAEATVENTKALFHTDKVRERTFCKHIAKGFYGVYLYNRDGWVSYAWLSRPSTVGPPHLPLTIQRMSVFWIFYCRTKEAFQGQGYYKSALQLLVRQAQLEDGASDVYIDTSVENVPSRRAITSVGFQPCGVIKTYTVAIPRIWSYTFGEWNNTTTHPMV